MSTARRSVLITGCSAGGIGAALASEFQSQGFHVFATARNTDKIPSDLRQSPEITTCALDVTSADSIAATVEKVWQVTGGSLDVLVNNSGFALSAAVLDTDLQTARDMFEVNAIGVLAATRAFAPLLVRGSDPCIVNNGSINGETNLPFAGVYGASKAAAMIMSETLRLECKPLGIRVLTVSTGIIETNLHANEPAAPVPANSFYRPVEDWIRARQAGTNRPPATPVAEYARVLVHRVARGRSGKVYIGQLTPLFVYLKWWLPSVVWDSFMEKAGPPDFYTKVSKALRGKKQ